MGGPKAACNGQPFHQSHGDAVAAGCFLALALSARGEITMMLKAHVSWKLGAMLLLSALAGLGGEPRKGLPRSC